ncbi:aspartyl-phosphate phosphatase Spo0E family protein [Paenibacillus sp. UNC451MF]|uniref:aspartyl-phosphate phosphatase Spo0E family protein n=1 Tax=Paenibacillus sp. UNC451MF TaxID=1449063 RepID=UPI0009DFC0D5|nr:aspartyl-phosphate phosphatase Spo0E family protein [Paenibacillus sp. UNC451MF]
MSSDPVRLEEEIEALKKDLAQVVVKHQYNFGHPDVLAISQKLDSFILKQMKSK